MSSKKAIKSAFESMMFTWGEPLPAKVAADVFNISKQEAIEYFTELQEEYEQEGRGIVIRRVMEGLIKKDLVCEKGRADTVGRPVLYGTTDTFLRNFGFSSIKELPEIEDIESIAEDAEADIAAADDGQIKIEI